MTTSRFSYAAHAARAAALAAFALVISSAAQAQSSTATSDTTGFTYQLIDLDLTDSITPGITFSERMVSTSHYDNSTGSIDYQQIETFGSTSMSRSFGSASTTSNATTWGAKANFALDTPYFQLFSAQNFYGMDFQLTPATGVLFRATVNLNAAHAGEGTRSEASARMFGYINHFGDDSYEGSDFNDVINIESGSRTYHLSGYLHSGAESLQGSFGISNAATATFYGGTSPIPEPQTYGMLLAGLGLIGWRMRNKNGS